MLLLFPFLYIWAEKSIKKSQTFYLQKLYTHNEYLKNRIILMHKDIYNAQAVWQPWERIQVLEPSFSGEPERWESNIFQVSHCAGLCGQRGGCLCLEEGSFHPYHMEIMVCPSTKAHFWRQNNRGWELAIKCQEEKRPRQSP